MYKLLRQCLVQNKHDLIMTIISAILESIQLASEYFTQKCQLSSTF